MVAVARAWWLGMIGGGLLGRDLEGTPAEGSGYIAGLGRDHTLWPRGNAKASGRVTASVEAS